MRFSVILSGLLAFAGASLFGQTVSSTTVLTANPPSAPVGTVITFTAAVTVNGVKASGGTVLFQEGTVVIGTGQVIFKGASAGSAIYKTNSFTPGTHMIKAVYSGAPTSAQKSRGSVSNSVTLTTAKALSSTALSVSPNGANFDLTAKVTGLGNTAPAGEVRLTNNKTGLVYDKSPDTVTAGGRGYLPQTPVWLANDYPGKILTGDFDGDGRLDMFVLDAVSPDFDYKPFEVVLNTSAGFRNSYIGASEFVYTVGFADFNADGLNDLLFVANEVFGVRLNSPDKPGTFFSKASLDGIGEHSDTTFGDFNGDGVLDIASTSSDSDTDWIDYGDPANPGHFLPLVLSPFNGKAPVLATDVNADGLPDVITRDSVYLRDPAHPDKFLPPIPLPGTLSWTPRVYDFDRDGLPDLIDGLTVFLNNPKSKGHFLPPIDYSGGNVFATFDLNGDGVLDLIYTDSKNRIGAKLGDPQHTGQFLPGVVYDPPAIGASPFFNPNVQRTINAYAALGDFNGDGIPDVATPVLMNSSLGSGQLITTDPPNDPDGLPPFPGGADFIGISYASVGASTYTAAAVPLSTTQPSDISAAFSGDANYTPSSTEAKFTGIADMTVNQTNLSYGAQPVNTSGVVHFVLKNTGQLPLALRFQISGSNVQDFEILDPSYPYDVGDGSCKIQVAVNESCTFQVLFHPQATGERLATLTLIGNGGPLTVTRVLPLAGPGLPALPSGPLTFSPVVDEYNNQLVGNVSVPSTITVTNTNSSSVQITNIAVGGDNPGDFAIVQNACIGKLAGQGGSCRIRVVFKPTAKGSRTGRINYTVNGNLQQSVVYGKGI